MEEQASGASTSLVRGICNKKNRMGWDPGWDPGWVEDRVKMGME
jgi:hypothetical protein